MLRSTLKALTASALAAGLLASASTMAASGTTQVDISFPPLIILYYFDDIDINMDADDLESLITGNNPSLGSCTPGAGPAAELVCAGATSPKVLATASSVTGGTATYDADIGSDGSVSPAVDTDVTIVLENSWAVRALASTLTASVALGGGDFSNPLITPTNPTPSLTLTDGQNIGDVQFDVDLDALAAPLTASDSVIITVVSP